MLDGREALRRHNELRARISEALNRLAELADRRGELVSVEGKETPRSRLLREADREMQDGRFTLAVLGEFSRGKSTLINALLGQETLLPTAIEPTTATVTVLVYGREPSVILRYEDGTEVTDVPLERLPAYVTGQDLDGRALQTELAETAAQLAEAELTQAEAEILARQLETSRAAAPPARALDQVEIQFPSDFLAGRIRLVDTPGIGSVNPRHGEATRRFVRQADAVLFLINTDPVISASECNFLTFIQDYVDHFLFVVTKIDRFSAEERERSLWYTRETITEFAGIENPRIFPVSALQALQGQLEHDDELIAQSGFPEFIRALDAFLVEGRGRRLVKQFAALARAHVRELRQAVQLERQSIEINVEELTRRIHQSDPVLEQAHETRREVITALDEELARVPELIMGDTGVDWVRLDATIREEVYAQLDECSWEELQQATEIIPVFVREIVAEALQPKIAILADHLAEVRARVVEAGQKLIRDLSANVAFELEQLGEVSSDEFRFELDRDLVHANLTQIGTLTIGSTIALALASGFLFGGIGALVMLGGGLVAGTSLTSVLRNRARERLKQELQEPLDELIETLQANLEREVTENLKAFRENVDRNLERAISSVTESLVRVREEAESARLNAPQRRQELEAQLAELTAIEELVTAATGE